MARPIFWIWLAGALISVPTLAIVHDVKTEQDRTELDISADGSYRVEVEYTSVALTRSGIERLGQQAISYSADHDEVEILDAETIKADGSRLAVDLKRQLFDQAPALNLSTPTISPQRSKVLLFPGLAIGDKIHLRYRISVREAGLPGRIDYSNYFYPGAKADDSRLIVHAPAGMPLQIEAEGVEGGVRKDKAPGQHWEWRWRSSGEYSEEEAQPSPLQRYPRVLLTNRKHWRELAQDYAGRARDKAELTPTLRALAEQETQGITDRRQMARKLYEWVAQNVRYVAITLGNGGYVPRRADEVLSSRYGDCKDHATLLQALLKAKGIDSDLALISNGDNYRLPKVPLQSFNHVINYLPEFDLYLDSTNSYGAFDALDFFLQDKPVLLVFAEKLGQTPGNGGMKAWSAGSLFLKPDADGNSPDSTVMWTTAGSEALFARGAIGSIAPSQAENIVTRWLADRQLLGAMTLHDQSDQGREAMLDKMYQSPRPAMNARLAPYDRFYLRGRLNRLGSFRPGGNAIIPSPPGMHGIATWVQTQLGKSRPRSTEFVCSNANIYEYVEVELPANLKPVSLPKNLELKVGKLRYVAKYVFEGNTLRVERNLERNRPNRVCSAEEDNRYQDLALSIDADLKTALIFH